MLDIDQDQNNDITNVLYNLSLKPYFYIHNKNILILYNYYNILSKVYLYTYCISFSFFKKLFFDFSLIK